MSDSSRVVAQADVNQRRRQQRDDKAQPHQVFHQYFPKFNGMPYPYDTADGALIAVGGCMRAPAI
jgi:hypothetical protein